MCFARKLLVTAFTNSKSTFRHITALRMRNVGYMRTSQGEIAAFYNDSISTYNFIFLCVNGFYELSCASH